MIIRPQLVGRGTKLYHEKTIQAKQPGDTQEGLAKLDGEVLKEFERVNSPCRPQWLTLYKAMKDKLKSAHSTIRKDLAKEQAVSYCPDLATGRWLPLEATALKNPPEKLYQESLKKLPIWAKAPTVDDLLLEETWADLLSRAKDRLKLCSEAIADQQKCVDAMKPDIEADIRGSDQRDVVPWQQQYKDEAIRNWRARSAGTPAGEAYPDLFANTIRLLNNIIDDFLLKEARDAQRRLVRRCRPKVQEVVDADGRRGVRPEFDAVLATYKGIVMADWKQDPLFEMSPGLLKEAEEAMKAAVSEIIRPQPQVTDTPPPPTREQPAAVAAPRPSDGLPSILAAPPRIDGATPRDGNPLPGGDSKRQVGESREPRAALPGGVGGRSGGAVEPKQGQDQALGTGGSDINAHTSDGPGNGTGPGSGTGSGGLRIPFWLVGIGVPLWLLLTVLLMVAAVAISRRRKARELDMLDWNLASLIARCGSTRAASALLAQMELAQRMLSEYQPDRPVETLSDLRQCSRQVIDQVQSGWRHCPDAAYLPDIATEIQQMLVGGVLACAMLSEVSGAGAR